MNQFTKYSSLTNTYQEKFVDALRTLPEQQWHVSEKIHGANFSFVITEESITHCSRNGAIEGKFYNYRPMAEALAENMRNLYEHLADMYSEVIVFGELYGAGVQRGVTYYADQRFACFDIAVDGAYMELEEVHFLCERFGIPQAHSYGWFSLEEALNFPNDKPTMHTDEDNPSISEGVVIVPAASNTHLRNGSRAVLKNKNAVFSEKSKARKPSAKVELTEEDLAQFTELSTLINVPRVASVMSKEQSASFDQFGKYVGKVIQDVYAEYGSKPEPVVGKQLHKLVVPLVREYLAQHQEV